MEAPDDTRAGKGPDIGDIRIDFPSNFAGGSTHQGLVWLTNVDLAKALSDAGTLAAIGEGRLLDGPPRPSASYSVARMEAAGIIGLYRQPTAEEIALAAAPTTPASTSGPKPEPATKRSAKPAAAPKTVTLAPVAPKPAKAVQREKTVKPSNSEPSTTPTSPAQRSLF